MSDFAKKYLEDIRDQKRDLMDQLKELRTLEKAIRGAAMPETVKTASVKANSEPTLKEMVLNVLRALNRGAEALHIADEIQETYGKTVMRSSLSPQLSRLKKDGKLILDDKVWYLPQQFEEYRSKQDRDLISQHADSEASQQTKPQGTDWLRARLAKTQEGPM